MKCHKCGYDNAEIMRASMKVERKQKELEKVLDGLQAIHSRTCAAGADFRIQADRAEARVAVLEKALDEALDVIKKWKDAT